MYISPRASQYIALAMQILSRSEYCEYALELYRSIMINSFFINFSLLSFTIIPCIGCNVKTILEAFCATCRTLCLTLRYTCAILFLHLWGRYAQFSAGKPVTKINYSE